MKKLINSPETVVTDALAGMAAAHPSLSVDIENKVVTRAGAPVAGKVGLVSGGGSGHEPLHAGFVGYGMLDAACAGEVFTSPVPDQIVIATTAVNGGAGVLHVVKNYTGDVLHFRMAAELAADDSIEVAAVVVNDDVAVQDSLYTAGARRGVRATVFVEKIARRAGRGGVTSRGRRGGGGGEQERSRSFGVALTSCTVPVAAQASPRSPAGDGDRAEASAIHGEPGRTRAPLRPARDIAAAAMDAVHADLPLEGDLLVMVNGMGGTPLIELYGLFNEVSGYVDRSHGARIARNLVGNYITSLEMQGFSVTRLWGLTDALAELWDAPVVRGRPGPVAGGRWRGRGTEALGRLLREFADGRQVPRARRDLRCRRCAVRGGAGGAPRARTMRRVSDRKGEAGRSARCSGTVSPGVRAVVGRPTPNPKDHEVAATAPPTWKAAATRAGRGRRRSCIDAAKVAVLATPGVQRCCSGPRTGLPQRGSSATRASAGRPPLPPTVEWCADHRGGLGAVRRLAVLRGDRTPPARSPSARGRSCRTSR